MPNPTFWLIIIGMFIASGVGVAWIIAVVHEVLFSDWGGMN